MAHPAQTTSTAGRPVRAGALMLVLLAAAGGLAWIVSAYKTARPIRLRSPVPVPGLLVRVSPPAGWPGKLSAEPLSRLVSPTAPLAAFMDPSTSRALLIYQFTAQPTDPGSLFAGFYPAGRIHAVGPASPARIGPLAARQAVITTEQAGRARKHILRAALVGDNEYLVCELACAGPPTPSEFRLMDRVADAVQLDGAAFRTGQELGDLGGITLGREAGDWLARLPAEPAAGYALTHRPGPAGQQAGGGFWGAVLIVVARVRPNEDLGRLLETQVASGPVPRWFRSQSGRTPAPSATVQLVHLGPGRLPAWLARAADGPVVRLVCFFRPAESDPGIEPDESPSPPHRDSISVELWVWASAEEEPAALAAIERLAVSIRRP